MRKIERILLWLQQYTHLDMIYFAKGGFLLTLGDFAAIVCSLITGLVFANALTKETYGQYSYILTIFSLLTITSLPGISTAITQSVASGYEGNLIRPILTQAKWSLIGTLIGFIIALFYFISFHNLTTAAYFLLAGLFVPLTEPLGNAGPIFEGKKRFDLSTLFFTFSQVFATVVLVAVAITGKSAYLLFIFSCLAGIPLAVIALKKALSLTTNNRVDPGVVSYGKHLTVISIGSTIASYLDRLLVFNLLGPVQLAIYTIAISPPEQIKGFLNIATSLSLPKFSEQDAQTVRPEMSRHFLKLFVIALPVIGGYILVAPLAFKLLFPKYLEAVIYSQIFALSMFNFILYPAGTFLQAKRHIREQYWSNLASSVFQIASMIIMILVWGLLGLIIARVITRILTSLFNVFLFYRLSADKT